MGNGNEENSLEKNARWNQRKKIESLLARGRRTWSSSTAFGTWLIKFTEANIADMWPRYKNA